MKVRSRLPLAPPTLDAVRHAILDLIIRSSPHDLTVFLYPRDREIIASFIFLCFRFADWLITEQGGTLVAHGACSKDFIRATASRWKLVAKQIQHAMRRRRAFIKYRLSAHCGLDFFHGRAWRTRHLDGARFLLCQ